MPVTFVDADVGGGLTPPITTGTVAPGTTDRALLAFNAASYETPTYSSAVRENNSGGALLDQFESADIELDIFTFTFEYAKIYGEAGGSGSAVAAYNEWSPTSPWVMAAVLVALEGVDQTTPYDTEQLGTQAFFGADPVPISDEFTGLGADRYIVGALYIFGLGELTSVSATAGGDIENVLATTLAYTNEGRHVKIIAFEGHADGSGVFAPSFSVDWDGDDDLIVGRIVIVPVNASAGGSDPEPLTAETGAFTLTGGAAGLRASRRVTAQAGAYALGGGSATLAAARRIAALAGAFTLAGGAAGLRASRRIVGGAGAFALTGGAAGLLRALRVTGSAGSFALTGGAVGLQRQLRVTAQTGAFVLTGNDATLTVVSVFILTAEAGAYSLTGNNAGLRAGRRIVGGAGAYTLGGGAAGLRAGRRLVAAAGAFALTGNDATLTYQEQTTVTLQADAGAFVWSGGVAGLRKGSRLPADAGAYALAGGAANFYRARHVAAETGAFTFTGGAAELRAARHLLALAGAFVFTGRDMNFNSGGIIDPSGERTVLIDAEDRLVALAAEDRTVLYAADYRIVSISQ